ncbi:hypothetical protein BON30_05165 [Cystobacter ferrugineus]|uniref:Uncharacterized protein n=1 Tax=Cystobacter ferrugineus TaxID=83449 RepID=A0A1L9BJZ0_9BACT|nr:hypothetical protein BON30_05165 [Cystobacter ferrugineus]
MMGRPQETQDPEPIFPQELRDAWPALSRDERVESFKLVPHATADDFFLSLSAQEQAALSACRPRPPGLLLIDAAVTKPGPGSDPIRQGPPKSVTPNSRIPVKAAAPPWGLAARLPWHGSC